MSAAAGRSSSGPCPKIVLAVFGAAFLIALLSVPVTVRTSELRRDPGSNIIVKTTYPRKARMFLPRYLSARAHAKESGAPRLRSALWFATLAIIAALWAFDHVLICLVLRARRRSPGGDASGEYPDEDPPRVGLSLFP
ncbi:MAG: hypothetical protein H6P95_1775 [Candidatus Aminicenantes bacterium]|jgi:dolichol kinase|nr:hypothetical protein [Candidatus Aminicenantes bacterium]